MSRSAHPAGPRHADVMSEGHYLAPADDLNVLDEKVWSRTVTRDEHGAVTVGGLTVSRLAEEFGTPAYFLDEADFRARCRAWSDAFGPGADVFYAGKAFLSRAVVRWLKEEGLNLDVCSGGELATALDAGMPAERIAFHGNNKTVEEIERAVAAGVGRIVLDSFQEIVRVAHVAQSLGRRQRVQIRVTVGVEAHTHEFIATAHEDQKFGIALAGGRPPRPCAGRSRSTASKSSASTPHRLADLRHGRLRGLRPPRRAAARRGARRARRRAARDRPRRRPRHRVHLRRRPARAARDRQVARRHRDPRVRGRRARHPRISVEPGRAIVGPTAFTLYEVGTIKPLEGLRTYVSVDGGMSDNIRTALYDAEYSVSLASRTSDAEPMLVRVVGKHCESGDIVVKDAYLPADLAPGDLIAVPATGAYCRSMASNYNHALRPPVVAVRDGEARVIVRRETEEDLLRLDVG